MDWLSESIWQGAAQLDNQSLELIGINNKIVSFKKIMSYWSTSMHLHTKNKQIKQRI
jgi:hypothetical protein